MDETLTSLSGTNLIQAAFLAHENPVFVVEWQTRRILSASESVERVFGWRPEELRDRYTDLLHVDEESFRRFGEISEEMLASEQDSYHCFFRMRRRNGEAFDTENMLGIIRDDSGTPVAAVSIVRDLSDKDAPTLPYDGGSVDLRALSERLPGGIFQRVRKSDGTIFYSFMRGNLLSRFGLSPGVQETESERVLDMIHPDDLNRFYHGMEKTAESLSVLDIELRAYTEDGESRWLRSLSQPRRLDDGSTVWDGLILDITEQRSAEGALRHMVLHDRLTGLPNISAFDERLESAIVHAHESGSQLLAGALDIDRFYAVNETLGFGQGDEALIAVGNRLQSLFHGNDVVARYEGDEFFFLAQDIYGDEEAGRLAQDVMALFEEPIELESGARVQISVNLGLSVYPDDGETGAELRREADLALQRVRKLADTRFQFYSEEMSRDVHRAVAMEQELEAAIRVGEITPHYQVQYSAETGRVSGMEVLARWIRPDGRMVSPGQFIPVAEETGLIHPMTRLLVRTVMEQLSQWREQGLVVPPVAINISAHQIRHPEFFEWFFSMLPEYGLDIDFFIVEITESAFLLDFAAVRTILDNLADRGVRLSIDDFGTGYSSLSYLSQLPFSELKIDRAFVSGIDTAATSRAVAKGIVELGHALGLHVVGEGVETREQLDSLRELGCDAFQGFLFSKPAPGEAITGLLEATDPHPLFGQPPFADR